MILAAAPPTFYGTAAQVIPVLLLVLAVDLARYRSPEEPLWIAYSFMGSVLWMVLGEAAAMVVLASGGSSYLSALLVASAIAIGLGVVFMRAGLLARDNLWTEQSKEVAKRFELVVAVASCVLMLGVGTALLLAAS